MNTWVRNIVMLLAVIGLGVGGGARLGLTAAGSPPDRPIDAVATGADPPSATHHRPARSMISLRHGRPRYVARR